MRLLIFKCSGVRGENNEFNRQISFIVNNNRVDHNLFMLIGMNTKRLISRYIEV